MRTIPYLGLDGRCAEAFRFYADVLGGTIAALISHGDSPIADQVPPDWHPRIMHAHLIANGVELMGGDFPPGNGSSPAEFSVNLQIDRAEDADRIFANLAEGGRVTVLIERTFWAERFGMLVDRFGTPWMVNYAGADTPEHPRRGGRQEALLPPLTGDGR